MPTIAIYKPIGPTSHDIVDQIRKITGIKKVGHAGTLDPLAEGVLVIAIGRESTKQLSSIVKKEKEYVAQVKFGQTSSTDDEEGEKTEVVYQRKPSQEDVQEALQKFIGHIKQVPPQFSAIKVKGKKAYKEARQGRTIELEPREVNIKEIELLEYQWPLAKLRVVTGPGVYIRSLARDLGEKLQVGAYLASLKRTRVGDFTEDKAYSIEDFKEHWDSQNYEK